MLPTDMGSAISLQEQLHDWKDEPLTPERDQTLRALVTRAAQLAGFLSGAWAAAAREGSVWESGYYSQRMRIIGFLASMVVDILNRAEQIVTTTQAAHPDWAAPPSALELKPKLAEAQQIERKAEGLLGWFNRPRPPVNQEMIRRSQDALSRGEGETIGDLVDRVRSGRSLVKE
jgi:hypothetical protein